ncbi:MAG: glycine cleavage system aminomethyltransferase GcvT [Rhodothermales bacterium]|nr:glycine cleavage system aminomethyltransferase GcvT [Rhodothermales bacterium]
MQTTPLHDIHVGLGARMMEFAGFDMPVHYGSIIEEHHAVRKAAGMFDVSHMGEVFASGPNAEAFIQQLVTNNVTQLVDGQALYTVMCRPDGGIIDDLLVYRIREGFYMLVVNASNIATDFAWMQENNSAGAELGDFSDQMGLIAVQGPAAMEVVSRVAGFDLTGLPFYRFMRPEPGAFMDCEKIILSHTGYTGEPGLEIYCEAERAAEIWSAVAAAGESDGLRPTGLGCRDTLRLEAGYCLYGNDLTGDTNPLEAGLGWLVKLEAGDFIGRDALVKAKADGLTRRLVAFTVEGRGIPRAGCEIVGPDGTIIGNVTSGTQSPTLGIGIGMGYVRNEPEFRKPGSEIGIQVRNKVLPAVVRRPPLHK